MSSIGQLGLICIALFSLSACEPGAVDIDEQGRTASGDSFSDDGSDADTDGLTNDSKASSTGVDPRNFGAKLDGSTDDTAAIRAAINHAVANLIPMVVVDGPTKISGQLLLGQKTPGKTTGIEVDFGRHLVTYANSQSSLYMLPGSYLHDVKIRVPQGFSGTAIMFHGREHFTTVSPLTIVERVTLLQDGHSKGVAIGYVTNSPSGATAHQQITSTIVSNIEVQGFEYAIRMGAMPWNVCGQHQADYINSNSISNLRAHGSGALLAIGNSCARATANTFHSLIYQSASTAYPLPVVLLATNASHNMLTNIAIWDLHLRSPSDNQLAIQTYSASENNHVQGFFAAQRVLDKGSNNHIMSTFSSY